VSESSTPPFGAIERPELLDLPDSIAGPRILLRAYRPGDGAALFAGLDPVRDELLQWMPWPVFHQAVADSESYARRMAAEFVLRKGLALGIWAHASGEFLGGCGFHAPDWVVPKAELGYFLLPAARGRGLATEATRLMIDYAFGHLKLNRVEGRCDRDNQRSAAVMRAAGMRLESTLRFETRDHHGKLRDTLLFALTSLDYEAWCATLGTQPPRAAPD
jgi:RimJ/RimL family protein N-acetyltransferase